MQLLLFDRDETDVFGSFFGEMRAARELFMRECSISVRVKLGAEVRPTYLASRCVPVNGSRRSEEIARSCRDSARFENWGKSVAWLSPSSRHFSQRTVPSLDLKQVYNSASAIGLFRRLYCFCSVVNRRFKLVASKLSREKIFIEAGIFPLVLGQLT